MNFLFIISDTLRRDYLNCYADTAAVSGFAGGVRTPHLDALAAESVVMTRCYEGSFPTIPMLAPSSIVVTVRISRYSPSIEAEWQDYESFK